MYGDYSSILNQVFSLKTYKRIIILVVVVIMVLAVYTAVMDVDLGKLLSANPILISLSVLIITLVNIVDALRLNVLVRSVGYHMKFVDALRARLMGNIVAIATPSSIGGEPARALILSTYGINMVRAIVVTLFEDYWDIVLINVPALILALTRLPISIIVLLTATYNIVAWNVLFLTPRVRRIQVLVEKLYDRSKGFIRNVFAMIIVAAKSINIVVDSARRSRMLLSILVFSITKYVLLTLAFYLAALSVESIELVKAFEGLLFYNAMGVIPTPGASGGLEYGLSLVLEPAQVVIIRVIVFTTTLILGLPLLVLYLRGRLIKSSTDVNVLTHST